MGTRRRGAYASRRNAGDHAYDASRCKQGAWRTASLCAQARRAIESALCGCADERLDGLYVEDVSPAPNASRLLVVLRGSSDIDAEEVRDALAGAEGLLRSEVAAAITRKRTPRLAFVLLRPDEVDARLAAHVEGTP